ncbi:MAG: CHAT domain-containing protein [Cyanobacteria bacterium P01_F01_bin.143]
MTLDNLIQLGVQEITAGKLELAEQTFRQALNTPEAEENLATKHLILKHLTSIKIRSGDYALAENMAKQSLEVAEDLSDKELICKSLNNLGLSYYWQEKYLEAIDTYKEALEYTNEGSEDTWKIWSNLGQVYDWQGNYKQALEAHQQSLTFAHNDTLKAKSLFYLGQTQFWANNHFETINYLEESLNLVENSQQDNITINVLNILGQTYYICRQWHKAEEILQQQLELVGKLNVPIPVMSILDSLIRTKMELNKIEEAKNLVTESINLAKLNGQQSDLASALQNLGLVQCKSSDFSQAIKAFGESLAIYRQLPNTTQEEIAILLSLGSLHEQQGNYTQAISCFQQTSNLAKVVQDYSIVQLSSKNLGQIYLSLGDYPIAIDYFQKYLTLAQVDGKITTDIEAYQKLGDAYHDSGDFKKGIANYQQALSLAEESNNLEQKVQVLVNLLSGYRALEDYDQAIKYEELILEITHSEEFNNPMVWGKALSELTSLKLLLQNPQAIDYAKELLTLCQITNAYPVSFGLQCLSNAYSHFGKNAEAISCLQEALELLGEDRQSEGEILTILGRVYLQANNFIDAEETLKKAIAVWEDLRTRLGDLDELKIPLLTKQKLTYQLLQTVLVTQGKYHSALEISELGRARSLADILNHQSIPNLDSNQTIEHIKLAEIIEIAKTLNATLIEYSETLEALYIWVIKPTGEVYFEQVPIVNPYAVMTEIATKRYQDNKLSLAIKNIRFAMGISEGLSRTLIPIDLINKIDVDDLAKALTKVYEFLIKPIEQYLPKNPEDKLIFIPQGYLFNVPFAALIDNSNFYLIEKHTISTAPSIDLLKLILQAKHLQNSIAADAALVVGNPLIPELPGKTSFSLVSLPGAEEEAIKIAQILGVSPLTGAEATKARVIEQIGTASIIHLATHGLLDYRAEDVPFERNILGAIALAPEQPLVGDGLLTSNEISTMSLQASLAVLSACHTGRGEVTADGVIGLSRAFMMAGVSSVLVSLWAIPDDYTATLMENFYTEMKQSNDLARSLRQAMLTVITNNQHPLNWAAFTLIGW